MAENIPLDNYDGENLFPAGETSSAFGTVDTSKNIASISDTPIDPSTGSAGDGIAGYIGLSVDTQRLGLFFSAMFLLFFVVVIRSAFFQLIGGGAYLAQAEGNRSRIEWIPSERGILYDRHGTALVSNVPSFDAVIVPADLPPQDSARKDIIVGLASTLGITPLDIEIPLNEYGPYTTTPVTVYGSMTHEQAILLHILSKEWTGVSVKAGMRREYLHGEDAGTLSHLLGYEGKISPSELEARTNDGYLPTDRIGKSGLEYTYEDLLRGEYGKRRIEVDATGGKKTVIAEQESEPGTNLVLSIDLDLQREAERVTKLYLERAGKTRASVVILQPQTGEVLALLSYPGYDNNLFAQGISTKDFRRLNEDEDNPLFPRATAASMSSGSTFKLIVAAAALEEDIVTPSTTFLSTGGLAIKEWFFPDWKYGGHGWTNITKAIAQSVNTYFYIVGGGFEEREGLGIAEIKKYAEKFGLGSRLGIDVPSEGAGFLPTKEWKQEVKGERWYIGDTYHAAIGQGDILVTPLQIAAMTSVFANGGRLMQPHLLNVMTTEDGQRHHTEDVLLNSQVVSDYAINEVRHGMREAVISGSARSLSILPVTSAGKTGTAQWSSTKDTHAWFTSFAPYEDAELVITVAVEEGGEGSAMAAPIARDIYAWFFAQ